VTGTSGGWVERTYSLGAYQGQDVRVRFRFYSDYSVTRDGWYVDDVTIATGESITKREAMDAIDTLIDDGWTSIGAGVEAADGELDRFPGDPARAMIVMTDGQQNTSPEPIGIINSQVDSDIRIFTIGFGYDADADLLTEMADLRNGLYYYAADEGALQQIYAALLGTLGGHQQILNTTSTIYPGQQQFAAIQVDPSATELTVGINWPGSDLDLTLVAPDGTRITPTIAAGDPDIAFGESATYEFYQLAAPTPGLWTLEVLAIDVPAGGEDYNTYAMVDSPLRAILHTDSTSYDTGTPVTVQVDLTDGQPILGATVTARVTPPEGSPLPEEQLVLYDDGAHNDGAAADGVYANQFTSVLWPGNYTVAADALGESRAGFTFSRSPSVTVRATGSTIDLVQLIDSHTYADGVTVSVYDANPGNGISAPDIAWDKAGYNRRETDLFVNPGKIGDAVISSITVLGDDADTADLGIIIHGNTALKKFIDKRPGTPPLGFLISAGSVGTVKVKGGLAGANVHGLVAPGGWALGSDIDGDGDSTDSTAYFTLGTTKSIDVDGDVLGDVVSIGGITRFRGRAGVDAGLTTDGMLKKADVAGDWGGSVKALRIGTARAGGELTASFEALAADPKGVAIASLQAAQATGVTVVANGGVKTIKAEQWTGGDVQAHWITSITTTGNKKLPGVDGEYTGDLHLSGVGVAPGKLTLGKARIAGRIACTWEITGNTGSIVAQIAADTWILDATGYVKSLSTIDGIAGMLSAQWFGSVKTRGVIAADLTATGQDTKDVAIGKLQAAAVAQAAFEATSGGVKSIKTGAWTDSDAAVEWVGKMSIATWLDESDFRCTGSIASATMGGMRHSRLYAGVQTGLMTLPDDDAQFDDPTAVIGNLTVKGIRGEPEAFLDACVAAGSLGKVSVTSVRTDNSADGGSFGITACDIGLLTWKQGRERYRFPERKPGDWPAAPDDFVVEEVV